MQKLTLRQERVVLRDLFKPQDGHERFLSFLCGWLYPYTVESIRSGLIMPPLTDEDRQNIDKAISSLEPRRAEVVKKFCGVGCDPQSTAEIAAHFVLSDNRIRQIRDRAWRELRHPSRRQYLEGIPSNWASLKDELATLRQQADEARAAAEKARMLLQETRAELEVLRQYQKEVAALGLPVGIKLESPESRAQALDSLKKQGMIALLRKPVDELVLSVRASNCLKVLGITTLWELVQKTELELLKVRNFGRKSLNELNAILEGFGLRLGMDVPQYRQYME